VAGTLNGGATEGQVKIVRGRVDSLSLYEVTDNELKTLELGSPGSIYLNFSIFLTSIGLSFLISLLTVKIDSVKIYSTFLVFAVLGLVLGLILFILWWRQRKEVAEVISTIKSRMPSSEKIKGKNSKADENP